MRTEPDLKRQMPRLCRPPNRYKTHFDSLIQGAAILRNIDC